MRFITYLATLLFAVFLAACGGGGGSPGLPSVVKTPITTSAAAALTVVVGATQSFSITGGTAPYQISSSNVKVAVASLDGRSFAITGVAAGVPVGGVAADGTATITISDASQQSLVIAVTVPAPTKLFSTAPVKMEILNGSTNFYTVYGGVPPYVVNTNGVIARTSLSGSSLAITGVVVGHQTVAISDAVGASITIDVTVNAGMFTDAPSNFSVANGSSTTYAIYGGVPYSGASQYRVNSSNPANVGASISGSTVSVSGLSAGQATLIISDSVNASVSVIVTVPVAGAITSSAPSSLKLAIGRSETYALQGGDLATYYVSSSNPSFVTATVDKTKSTLTITAVPNTAGGTAQVIVSDAKGSPTLTIAVEATTLAFFTTAPSNLAIAAGLPKVFALIGGSGFYSVVNTHPDIAMGSISGAVLTITGIKAGSTSVLVSDSSGTSIPIAVTVTLSEPSPSPLFTTAPGTLNLPISAEPVTYAIMGGSPNYIAQSSNPSVVDASATGNTLSIRALASGRASVIVKDALNQSVTIDVSVASAASLFSDAPGSVISLVIGNSKSYTVGGGTAIQSSTAKYFVNSTNPGVLKAEFVGDKLIVTGLSNGTSTVRVTDAVGARLDIDFSVGTGTGTGTTALPTMVVSFVDDAGVEITNHVLSQTQLQKLKIVLRDATGAVAPYTRVQVALDSSLAVLAPTSGTQLSDQSGVVLMRITPSNVSSSGTVRATVTATINGAALTSSYDLQINPGTVTFSAVTVSPASVQKGQSVNASVTVLVNGQAAASNSVSVTFSTACGTVSPSSSLVDASGKAQAVIQTTSSGNCAVDASVSGVTSNSAAYTVTAAPTTNIQFVNATPTLLYQKGSAGPTTSIVKFKVIDSVANGVPGIPVTATLTNTDGGIDFCGSPFTGTTSGVVGSEGTVTFSICSGTLPATVQVRASFVNNGVPVTTSSNLLTIQTGLPTQRFFDISATELNFYVGGYFTSGFNGNSVSISVFAADRQGNPVPDGTKIVFVTEGGQINSVGQSSCLIANGRCSVSLIGQDYRPMGSAATNGEVRPGRVTVLAYTDGEESFVDANYNNRYDVGELIEDLGTLYLDKDESQLFAASYKNLVTGTDEGEFAYPMPAGTTGASTCPANSNIGLSYQSTCNGTWDGLTKVRRSIVIVFSGGEIGQPGGYHASIPAGKRTQVLSASTGSVVVQLADLDGNPLPASAGLSVDAIPDTCAATLLGSQIGSTTEPTVHAASLKDCVSGDTIRFKVDVQGKLSSFSVRIP